MAEAAPKLAYVVRVQALDPIPKKDLIEVATLHGWKCIVRKGEFKVGDLALYFAIGCVPDFEDPNFSFLKEKGYNRIKTMKMGGVISQGLLGKLSWMEARGHDMSGLCDGDDVSHAMGVTKYIPDEERAQYDMGSREPFPEYVPKTDATRLQHSPEQFFQNIADKEVVITRKEDGCSCTCIMFKGNFKLCSRNFVCDAESGDSASQAHYFEAVEKTDLRRKLESLPGRNIAIQGEIVGPKVSCNRLKLMEREFVVFDVFDIDTQQYLLYEELCALCAELQLKQVPLVYKGSSNDLSLDVDYFLQLADKQEYQKGVTAEGIVVKTNDTASNAARTVFKVIANKYLLKHDL